MIGAYFCTPPAQSTAVDLDGSAVADSGGCSLPYTFDRHAARPDPDAVQFVQIQVGKHCTCAFIQGQVTLANGVDLWQLEGIYPYMGRFYRAPAYVRQCSGLDGRCTCADEPEHGPAAPARTRGPACGDTGALSGGAVRSAPDGNHGENN